MISASCDQRGALLESVPFFKEIDDRERGFLLKHTVIKSYPKRSNLFLQGDVVDSFLIIIKGWVKVYSLTDDGKEMMSDMFGPGEFLGGTAIFGSTTHRFSAIISEDTQLAGIPAAIIKERVWSNEALAKQIMTIMTKKINALQIENGHLINMSAEQRLCCLLLRLSAWMVGDGGSFTLPYDKSEMASQLGIEQATFSRLFARVEDKGITKKGAEIHIKDFSVVSSVCCNSCPIPEGQCKGRRLRTINTIEEKQKT